MNLLAALLPSFLATSDAPNFVAAFTIALSGTYPNQRLLITDANGDTFADYSSLHSKPSGSLALCPVTITKVDVNDTINTPDGPIASVGFDLIYSFNNNTLAECQLGAMQMGGFRLGSDVSRMAAHIDNQMHPLAVDSLQQTDCPGSIFAPVALVQGSQMEVGACVLIPRHAAFAAPITPCEVNDIIDSGSSPFPGQWRVQFGLNNHDDNIYASLLPGQTATYRMCVRFQARTTARTGGKSDGMPVAYRMLHPFKVYAQATYGKPRYPQGRDGRAVFTRSLVGAQDVSNQRGFKKSPDLDPTTGTGYAKLGASVIGDCATTKCHRVIISALCGFHYDAGSGLPAANYPFRFATGLIELGSLATTTIAPAISAVRNAGIQTILWWGNSTQPEKATVWDGAPTGNQDFIDPASPASLGKAHLEGDYGRRAWSCDGFGLDAFLYNHFPWQGVAIIQGYMQRWPGAVLIGEQGIPHYLLVLMPTYIIEPAANYITEPNHLHHYFCPGSECLLEGTNYSGNPAEPNWATLVAGMGYSPTGAFSVDISAAPVAADRWTELGETPLQGFDKPLPLDGDGQDRGRRLNRLARISRFS